MVTNDGNLEKDEEIIWQKKGKKYNLFRKKGTVVKNVVKGLGLIFLIIGFIFLAIFPFPLVLFLILGGYIMMCSSPSFSGNNHSEKTFYETYLNLNYGELINFQEIWTLTNKQFFQKERNMGLFKYATKYPGKISMGKYGIAIDLAEIKIMKVGEKVQIYLDPEEYRKQRESPLGLPFKENEVIQYIANLDDYAFIETREAEGGLYYKKGIEIEQYEVHVSKKKHDIKKLGKQLKKYRDHLKETKTIIGYLNKVGLPIIKNPYDLASFLNIKYDKLKKYCITEKVLSSRKYPYRSFSLDKKSGGKRYIFAPKTELKKIQKKIYEEILKKIEPSEFAHGFRENHSTVTNAKQHLGAEIIYCLDIKDFFPSIKYNQVMDCFRDMGYSGLVSSLLASLCSMPYRDYQGNDKWRLRTYKENNLPQGAPTSPALSNLVCRVLDNELDWIAQNHDFKYTRYADDLAFSSRKNEEIEKEFVGEIYNAIEKHEFELNELKQNLSAKHVKFRNFKYRRVNGIIVHKDYLSLPRRWTRNLRAALNELEHVNSADDPSYIEELIKNIEGRCAYALMVNEERYNHFFSKFKKLKKIKLDLLENIQDKFNYCPHCGIKIRNRESNTCKNCGKEMI